MSRRGRRVSHTLVSAGCQPPFKRHPLRPVAVPLCRLRLMLGKPHVLCQIARLSFRDVQDLLLGKSSYLAKSGENYARGKI